MQTSGPYIAEAMKAAAKELWHLMPHRCNNPYRKAWQTTKTVRSQARRQDQFTAIEFGDEITADHIVSAGASAGGAGEEYAVAVFDRATKRVTGNPTCIS